MPGLTALIPLDGTQLSESAFAMLPFIKTLGFERVLLASVWESSWESDPPAGREAELREVAEKGRAYLDAYLADHLERVRGHGFETEAAVRIGRAADQVLEVARDDVDLIIIATHGRTGIARWRLGSVANEIIREAPCPSLVIGPNVSVQLTDYKPRHILAPLDGSALAEQALPVVSWIARLTGASVNLVRAVSITPMAYDPSMGLYSVELLQTMEDAATAYLERQAASLSGVSSVTSTMLRGPAAEQLLDYVQESGVDLVVMASHGRAGIVRAVLGSVAERVLHGAAPVLVLRPEGLTSRLEEAVKAAG